MNRKLRVGMYHQHFNDLLNFDKTPVQYLGMFAAFVYCRLRKTDVTTSSKSMCGRYVLCLSYYRG